MTTPRAFNAAYLNYEIFTPTMENKKPSLRPHTIHGLLASLYLQVEECTEHKTPEPQTTSEPPVEQTGENNPIIVTNGKGYLEQTGRLVKSLLYDQSLFSPESVKNQLWKSTFEKVIWAPYGTTHLFNWLGWLLYQWFLGYFLDDLLPKGYNVDTILLWDYRAAPLLFMMARKVLEVTGLEAKNRIINAFESHVKKWRDTLDGGVQYSIAILKTNWDDVLGSFKRYLSDTNDKFVVEKTSIVSFLGVEALEGIVLELPGILELRKSQGERTELGDGIFLKSVGLYIKALRKKYNNLSKQTTSLAWYSGSQNPKDPDQHLSYTDEKPAVLKIPTEERVKHDARDLQLMILTRLFHEGTLWKEMPIDLKSLIVRTRGPADTVTGLITTVGQFVLNTAGTKDVAKEDARKFIRSHLLKWFPIPSNDGTHASNGDTLALTGDVTLALTDGGGEDRAMESLRERTVQMVEQEPSEDTEMRRAIGEMATWLVPSGVMQRALLSPWGGAPMLAAGAAEHPASNLEGRIQTLELFVNTNTGEKNGYRYG